MTLMTGAVLATALLDAVRRILTWVGGQSRAERVLAGWAAAEGTRPRISLPRISSRTRLDIRGRVPSQAAHPSRTRFARDCSPTHVTTRSHNQVPHQQILIHCYKNKFKF